MMQEYKHSLCPSLSSTTQTLLRSPVNSTNTQEALGKATEVQLQGKCSSAKMEKDVPSQPSKRGQHHRADNATKGEMEQNTPSSPAGASEKPSDSSVLQSACRRECGSHTWMLKLWDWMKGRVMFL